MEDILVPKVTISTNLRKIHFPKILEQAPLVIVSNQNGLRQPQVHILLSSKVRAARPISYKLRSLGLNMN